MKGWLASRLLAASAIAVLLIAWNCTKQKTHTPQAAQAPKTTPKEKPKKKKQSPILSCAQKNRLFDAKTWLESDRAFSRHAGKISEHDRIIKKMARRYGFDWRLIAAQIYAESNFKNAARSHVGALGLMQIMPSTARFMGTDPGQLLLPEINIGVGCMYNQRMYSLWGRQTSDKHQRLAFALASYNAGRGRVLKSYSTADSLITWTKVHPKLPHETQLYVHKIYLKHHFYSRYLLP